MKEAVVNRQMPPWFADPAYGHFANDRRLSEADIKTISTWADGGAPEGDAKDKPAPVTFQDGWNIKPDMIIEMPKDYNVPATGTVNYQNVLVKVNFPEDVWVIAAEMRPGNPQGAASRPGACPAAGIRVHEGCRSWRSLRNRQPCPAKG